MFQKLITKIKQLQCPLSKDKRLLLCSLYNDYSVTDGVVDFYKREVKGNKEAKYYIVKRKLIRNIALGTLISDYDGHRGYRYGNLEIYINDWNRTINYINNAVGHFKFSVDVDKKKWLDRKLRLEVKWWKRW